MITNLLYGSLQQRCQGTVIYHPVDNNNESEIFKAIAIDVSCNDLNPEPHYCDAMHTHNTTLSLVHNVREGKNKKKIEDYIFSIDPKTW